MPYYRPSALQYTSLIHHANVSKSQTNTLQRMVETYPDKPWDWESLSMNEAISLTFMLEHPNYPWLWEFVFAFHTHRFIHPYHVETYGAQLRSIYEQRFANPTMDADKQARLSATDTTYTFDTYLLMNSADIEHVLLKLNEMSDDTFTNVLVMSAGSLYVGYNCLWWNPYFTMSEYSRIIALIDQRLRTLLYEKRRIYYTVATYTETFNIADVRVMENISVAEANATHTTTMRHIYECLSIHPNIHFADVESDIHKPWFWVCLWSRSVIDWTLVERCMNSRNTREYVKFATLSRNKSLPWEFVVNHLEYPWVWAHVIANQCFTMEHLRTTLGCPSCVCHESNDIGCLCSVRNSAEVWLDVGLISEGYMLLDIRGPNGPVCRVRVPKTSLLANPNFAMYFRNVRWNSITQLFSNIGFKVGVLGGNVGLLGGNVGDAYNIQHNHGWGRCVLSSNPSVSDEVVRRYADVIQWDWGGLSLNPSLSYAFLAENSDRLHWQLLSKNHFHLCDTYKEHAHWMSQRLERIRVRCARRVLRRSVLIPYLEWYYNPSNPRMKERMRETYEELTQQLAT